MNNSKISELTIHTLCSMIQNCLNLSLKVIANQYNLNYYVVREIYRGHTWKHVSKNYDFSGRKEQNKFHKNKGDW